MSSLGNLDLCRLCLVKDRVSVPIFEGEGDVRQIFLKITACLPVKVNREDKLPKKICDDCVYKVELCYQFWHTTANAEKQLLQWLGEVNMEDKQGYNVLNPNGMKEQNNENRLDGTVMQQVSEHQNNMNMGMMDNMGLSMPIMMSSNAQQQITSVPMDNSGSSVQNVQPVAGPSTQATHDQITQNQTDTPTQQEEEEESSEEEENSDDECDGDEGLPIKEESEEDPNNSRTIEPTTFVNVSLACDEAGPSGLQQQKIADMPEMVMSQTTDVDPKTGKLTADISISEATSNRISVIISVSKRREEKKSQEKDCEKEKRNSFGCDVCPRHFKNKYLLKQHKLTHTVGIVRGRETGIKKNPALTAAEPRNQALSCAKCNFRCNKRSTMIAHLAEKHEEAADNDRFASSGQKFNCIVCDVVFSRKETLRSHFIRKHTQHYDYSCNYCGKEFKIKGDLTTHIRLKHQEEPVVCDVCGKTCRNSHSLYTHQKHAHYKAKYECPQCHRRLVTQENLNQHILTQHEKKEKSVCEECGKMFFENHDLKKHMRIHTGDKPYICTVCKRAFARHSSLNQHLLLHTGERIYACDVCNKSFAQKAGLICHRKIHTGVLPPLPVIHIDHIVKEFTKK